MLGPVVNIALALWLVLTTVVSAHGPGLLVNAVLSALLVVASALVVLRGRTSGHYLGAVVGGWLVFSPILFGGDSLFATLNAPLVGTLVATIALWPEHSDGEPLLTTIAVLGENG